MAEKIRVTPEVLDSTAGSIEGLAEQYMTQITTLYSTAGDLKNTWQGKDNVAFVEQIETFRDDLEKMHKLMQDYATYLRNTAKSYRATQDNIVSQARSTLNY